MQETVIALIGAYGGTFVVLLVQVIMKALSDKKLKQGISTIESISKRDVAKGSDVKLVNKYLISKIEDDRDKYDKLKKQLDTLETKIDKILGKIGG
jgi:chromosome segregation ATPase